MADAVGTILQVRFGAELHNGFGRKLKKQWGGQQPPSKHSFHGVGAMGLGRSILIFGGIVYGEGRSCKAATLQD